ncbi:MAG: methyltransferase [Candidatus Rokubacteria bacterium]|nr:methyltransferase [Candidatus Rokubacteria bacterium]
MPAAGRDDEPLLTFAWRGCVFRVPDGVQPPKAGSLLFSRNVSVREGERLLEIGTGMGLTAVLAARAGARVVATDVVPAAVEATRMNAALNGVTIDARLGDCYAPVAGERFDVIAANPPQMPTPPGRERDDARAAADNGGVDGWSVLDRIIAGAPAHLVAGGRVVFGIFGFLGEKRARARLEAAGFSPAILARETQGFPRIGYERLEHIRGVDAEVTLPARGTPATVERIIVQGTLAR